MLETCQSLTIGSRRASRQEDEVLAHVGPKKPEKSINFDLGKVQANGLVPKFSSVPVAGSRRLGVG